MSGWYPDPTGRFEYRYHNDRHWTADVSSGGRRFVDPLGAAPGPLPPPAPGAVTAQGPAPAHRNGIAIAGMVCGIVAAVSAWIPFIGIVGLAAGVIGLALSIVGLSRSRPTGHRRGPAIAGIVTSSVGIVMGVLGIVLSVALFRAVERFEDPGPYDAQLSSCTVEDGMIVARGEIENQSSRQRDYTVLVELVPGQRDRVAVDDVPAGGSGPFTVRGDSGRFGAPDTSRCRIVSVDGPVPFGLDPSLFE